MIHFNPNFFTRKKGNNPDYIRFKSFSFKKISANMWKYILPSLLFLTSCNSAASTLVPTQRSIRYLALGDSYTIGQGVAENERWP